MYKLANELTCLKKGAPLTNTINNKKSACGKPVQPYTVLEVTNTYKMSSILIESYDYYTLLLFWVNYIGLLLDCFSV